ncbi:hypothetical protein HK413_10350 [Mucilaginibacter sp. S1162]|uniref:Uncharacterized protein n=1 Tax=Mucilaginibacter humi TaxID=2732510 RepID=A0ABX1W432_9SPHI|nr:hypothetical protein [Mucilaginibacter humi]NNU34431.1 hypothetical protein [Mucilaginibacter humi]
MISGCGRQNEQRFTGTYVTSLKDEYGTSDDTLIISVFGSGEGMYQIKKNFGFNRLRDGKLLPREYKQEEWIASYDAKKMVLQETAFGRQIYWLPEESALQFGSKYRKIK